MKRKYKVMLGATILLIICFFACSIHYLFHKDAIQQEDYAEVYVEESLSFNFLEGKEIDTNAEDEIYHFSIINTSNEPSYYNISLEGKESHGAVYVLTRNQEGFDAVVKDFPTGSSMIAKAILINGNETHHYTLEIKNTSKEHVLGTIQIELEKDMNIFSNVLLKNNVVNESSKTQIAQEAATEEEGLIKSTDDDGTCYYFRGKVLNNYVSFAGMLWRIVKINGDGSVRLILNDFINQNTQFYKANTDYHLDFLSSNVMETLTSWYQNNLESYEPFLSNAKFCSDTSYDDRGFSSLTRIYTNHNAIYECMGDVVSSKIGLLTADEVALAGGCLNCKNTSFYLYDTDYHVAWWTMSPSKNINGIFYYIEVSSSGQMNDGTVGTLFRGLRPVINLIKRTNVTGSGTKEDPYIVNNS